MSELEYLYKSRLTQLRIAKIAASRPKSGVKSGRFNVGCEFGLSDQQNSSEKILAKLTLKIDGFPSDSEEDAESVFQLEMEVRGIMTVPYKLGGHESHESGDFAALMCQPLYLFAARKAEQILVDMGVGNVKLDSDLRVVGDGNQVGDSSSTPTLELKTSSSSQGKPKRARKKTS